MHFSFQLLVLGALPGTAIALWMAAAPGLAENPDHLRQLLSTRQCDRCQLEKAGLVFANLEKASLVQVDLRQANLSRANLAGADLRGANLVGTVLFGANLSGTDLRGADLRGADLRGAFLGNAQFAQTQLMGAQLQGAIAIPTGLVTAADYYGWGLVAAERGRHQEAVEHYQQAIRQNATYAPAYLGRSLSLSVLSNLEGAIADARQAETLFKQQGNAEGLKTTQDVLKQYEISKNPPKQGGGNNFFSNLFQVVLSTALKFIF